jgi:outer membrane protein assembly factor BamD (BamD/ComL family)
MRDCRAGGCAWRGLFILLLLLLTSGCSAVWRSSPAEPTPSEAERLVARADALAGQGEGRAAQYLYQRVVREFPGDPAAAAALYGLGRLEADPASGLRNNRAAYLAFSRLVTEYPGSRWAADARGWQATLRDLLEHEDETARIKLKLRWREEEAAGLRLQIQQLKSLDLGLERRP